MALTDNPTVGYIVAGRRGRVHKAVDLDNGATATPEGCNLDQAVKRRVAVLTPAQVADRRDRWCRRCFRKELIDATSD